MLHIVFFANVGNPASVEGVHIDDVIIYPNPANEFIEIRNQKNIQDVTIYNATGQKIKIHPIRDSNIINTTNLSNGLYYIKITTEKGIIIKKVIIQ